MFRKEFKVKSNIQLKRTELKSLKSSIAACFPNLSEPDISEILPKKEQIHLLKVTTFSGETVQIYTAQNKPLFLVVNQVLVPTVFLLWRYPLSLTFTTHPSVLARISNGADFMTPGIILPHGGFANFGSYNEGVVAGINTSENAATAAVGVTAQSSRDVSQGVGKCVSIYHYYGDKLCTLGGIPLETLPAFGPPEFLKPKLYEEDFPKLGEVRESIEAVETQEGSASVEFDSDVQEMDHLLLHSLLVALKYNKSLSLPILTSNFYKLQMLPACPEGKELNVKKSSYKKVGEFINEMSKIGLITTKELKKGVDAIVDFNKEHPKFTEFYIDPALRPSAAATNSQNQNISEAYMVTSAVVPLFREFGLQKGDVVQAPDVRKYVTEYIKKHNYQDLGNKSVVNVHGELLEVIKSPGSLTWEELFNKIFKSMKACYKISNETKDIFNKGKIEPIIMSISTRSGNKKVTLLDNLELFGISIQEFAKKCQHGVAASTSINQIKGKKSQQLLVQGNQIHFIHKLLKDEYKIPDKYLRGTELAKKL